MSSNTKPSSSSNNNIPFPQPSSSSSSNQINITTTTTSSNQDDFSTTRITDSRMSTRSRRAYYTPQTPRQFSRSAAKRDSVMALGSIAHLQHYFVKHGLASKDRPGQNKNLVLAIPGTTTTLTEEEEEEFDELPTPLPPPPMPSQPYFPPGRALPNLTDLESARREVMNQLDQVCESWGLIELTSMRRVSSAQSNRSISDQERTSNSTSPALRPTEDDFVVNLLALTTGAVRSVQKFILTLPDLDLIESTSKPGSTQGGLESRISHLELSTSARPRISKSVLNPFRSTSASAHHSSHKPFSRASLIDPFALFKKRLPSKFHQTNNNNNNHQVEESKEDPLSVLRRTSLDVLGCLKEIEFRYRIPGSATPTEPFQSTITSSSSSSSPDFSSDTPPLIIDTSTEDSTSSISTSTNLLPALSWDYRSDLGLQDVRQEAMVVKRWLEAVDGVLEGVTIINRRPSSFQSVNPNPNLKHKSSGNSIGLGLPLIKTQQNKFKKMFNSSKPNETGVPGISIQEEKEEESEEEIAEEEDEENPLEKWAREEVEEELEENANEEDRGLKKLIRAYECLRFFLPFDHLSHLKSPIESRTDFLKCLSDGMLVCIAYNIALRQSHRPWGFIPSQSIHNVIELEQRNLSIITSHSNQNQNHSSSSSDPNERIGLTYRRMDNLRVWAAALKLRYLIKSQGFEPKVVSRGEDGWEKMLESFGVLDKHLNKKLSREILLIIINFW
ncbi:uncharacterized protein MELLADRAFT_117173 [Melampsora larici-populina 98AG31]|uniref:Calponin-homology (CH) domain-containing protein n=1 Tax=Melampsora larici-populina (strain 98AG31 / pathotype 3-4-7) TaxID=747676 RepID=F4RU96_MELLP|nr:uncharacterized protein MELLADRAFT_117173 [Melampsora larici-populina 98AG31]EGG03898.1 hypothetical protein MELLADRAFT_117173 [Melampsora larici-populina 98AG31]